MRSLRLQRVDRLPGRVSLWAHSSIFIGILTAALIVFMSMRVTNPLTGQHQYIFMTRQEEIAVGLQTAPDMIAQYDGLDPDLQAQAQIAEMGQNLVDESLAGSSGYPFAFHLLANSETMNAFALPSGQVFITRALYNRLQNSDQIAAVLAHEIAHVIARHAAEQSAEKQMVQALTQSIYQLTSGAQTITAKTPLVLTVIGGQLLTAEFARGDEFQADQMAEDLLDQAGYKRGAMLDVILILRNSLGSNDQNTWFNSHPELEKRISALQEAAQYMELK